MSSAENPQPQAMNDDRMPSPCCFFFSFQVQKLHRQFVNYPRTNKSKHQCDMPYPWRRICMSWSKACKKSGLTKVILLSSRKLLCIMFLDLMIFLLVRIHVLSGSSVQWTPLSSMYWESCRSSSSLAAPILLPPYCHRDFAINALFSVFGLSNFLSILILKMLSYAWIAFSGSCSYVK